MEKRIDKPLAILATMLGAFSLLPLLQPHFFTSSDGLFHLYRLMEYDILLQQGVWPPRWAADFGFGLGLPVFNYYAPLTYALGDIPHLLGFGYIDSMKLLIAAFMLASALGAYVYARTLLSPLPSLFAAVFYTYVPYHIVNLYYRGDIAEYAALTWYPLILWGLGRGIRQSSPLHLVLSGVFLGALILTHNLSAFLFAAFLIIYAIGLLIRNETISVHQLKLLGRDIVKLAIVPIIAAALAAFFWIPAIAERSLVNIQRLAEYDFHDNFPTVQELLSASLIHEYRFVSDITTIYGYKLGLLQTLFLVFALIILVWKFRSLKTDLRTEVVVSLIVTAIALFFVFPVSTTLWEQLPLLNLGQFPWRFLGFIALPSALCAGFVAEQAPRHLHTTAIIVLVPLTVASSTVGLMPVMSNVTEADVTQRGSLEFEIAWQTIGTTSTNEYFPIWVQEQPAVTTGALATILGEKTPETTFQASAVVNFSEVERTADGASYLVHSDQETTLELPHLFFPGWTAWVDGQVTPIAPSAPKGLIKLDVPAGEHFVTLRFGETTLRKVADLVSIATIVTLLLVAGWFAVRWRRVKAPAPHIGQPTRNHLIAIAITVALIPIWLVSSVPYGSLYQLDSTRQYPLKIELPQGITLEGCDIDGVEPGTGSAARVSPGATFQVIVHWRVTEPSTVTQVRPYARLTNAFDQTWGYAEANGPSQNVGPDGSIVTRLDVSALPACPPGIYQLDVGLRSVSTGKPLQPQRFLQTTNPSKKGARVGPVIVSTGASISPARLGANTAPMLADSVNFGDRIHLLDLGLAEGTDLTHYRPGAPLKKSPGMDRWQIAAGETLHLDFLWQAADDLADDLWIMVRLVSADRSPWAIRDTQPADGMYPTSFWSRNEIVRDQANLMITPDTPPGLYCLEMQVISRKGPISILDQQHAPIGPALTLGEIDITPSSIPADPKLSQIKNRLDQPLAENLWLLGYNIGRPELQQGDSMTIELLWTATDIVSRDCLSRIRLIDEQGRDWAVASGRPVGETYPTTRWRKGEVLRGQYNLVLQAEAPEGNLDVKVELLDAVSEELVASHLLGQITVLPTTRLFSASPAHIVDKEFGGQMRLIGYELANVTDQNGMPAAKPGATIKIIPFWQALDQIPTSYTVFAQVLNSGGQLVAQDDSLPQMGNRPTTGWIREEIVVDEHKIVLPADLPAGDYTIIVGLYDATTGQRLTILDGADHATLSTLRILDTGERTGL